MVELRGLGVDYPPGPGRGKRIPALEGVDARFESGGVSAIVGASGCGKTSLIHAAAGLLSPSAGEVLINGKPVRGVRSRTGVIFQDFNLLPWRTVEANVELPLQIAGISKSERQRRASSILGELGLSSFSALYPDQLSGGMKQRVAIARSLVSEPDLLLMDEPFSSLDALTREAAQEVLLEIRKNRVLTIVLVTHSIEEAAYLAERVFVMGGRNPGTMAAQFEVPENHHSARFDCADAGTAVGTDGLTDFRASPRYFELCGRIRETLHRAESADRSAS
jgi:ABC-type nitrate/sulfonate/bicarbonate transport system ATPase subunit